VVRKIIFKTSHAGGVFVADMVVRGVEEYCEDAAAWQQQ
jgi:hypothetical protein